MTGTIDSDEVTVSVSEVLQKNPDKFAEEVITFHLRKLLELSEKSFRKTPQLEEPNEEQKQWVIRRMKGSSRSWVVWDQ